MKFRSKLEHYCYHKLQEAGVSFRYEPFSVILIPGFTYKGFCLERVGKKFKAPWKKQQGISYIPDFVGEGWIIETKGFERPASKMKWKLFKRWINQNDFHYDLYKPHSRRQVDKCVHSIKTNIENEKNRVQTLFNKTQISLEKGLGKL